MKTVITDNDSTLMKEEILDEIAKFSGEKIFLEIEKITNAQMNGDMCLSFQESLQKRVDILVKQSVQKITKNDLKIVASHQMNFSDGVTFLLQKIIEKEGTLKNNFFIFSGGFGEVIEEKILELEISDEEKKILSSQIYANYFAYNDDEIMGIDWKKSCMYAKNAKLEMTKNLLRDKKIEEGTKIIGIGDGSNDIGMIPKENGYCIAFVGNVYRENTVKKAEGRLIRDFFELEKIILDNEKLTIECL